MCRKRSSKTAMTSSGCMQSAGSRVSASLVVDVDLVLLLDVMARVANIRAADPAAARRSVLVDGGMVGLA